MADRLFVCGDLSNIGDLALLLQNIEQSAAQDGVSYVRRWGGLPEHVAAQVTAAGGCIVDGRRLLRTAWRMTRCDVIFCGGQLVRDNISRLALAGLLLGLIAARMSGRRVTVRGLGVSRVRGWFRATLWRWVLLSMDKVRVRDEPSALNAARLVPRDRIVRTADMAFLPSSLHRRLTAACDARQIVISPCIDGSEGRSIDGPGFPALLAAIDAGLPGLPTRYVCHDPRPGMDVAAATRLTRRHGPPGAEIRADGDLPALIADYRAAALVVSNRLHSLIFALIAHRPVLVIDDGTDKTTELAARFAVPVLRLDGTGDARAAIAAALSFDRDGRRRMLADLAHAAAGNLVACRPVRSPRAMAIRAKRSPAP